jgi:hypothetical protein
MDDELPPGFAVAGHIDDLPEGFSVVPQAAPAPPGVLADSAKSFGSGVVRGAAETAMLPVSLGRMGSDIQDRASAGLVGYLDPLVRSIMGEPQNTPEVQQHMHDAIANEPPGPLGRTQDAVRGVMDNTLYAPKTTPGKFAETVGEFAVPGGMPSRATRGAETLLRRAGEYAVDLGQHAVIPGVASEAAGQATEGTPYEPIARLIGAIFGNAGVSGLKAVNTPEAVLRRAAGPADDIDWQRALNLQNNGTGIRLTGPEALAHAQGGASGLPDVMKNVEGSLDGRAVTAPFFAARPAQTDTAVGNLLNAISPQSPIPSVLGPRASDAATTAIRGVEQERTAATHPVYQAANTDTVPADAIQNVLDQIHATTAADQTGVLSGPLNDLRNRLIAEPARPGTPAVRTPVLGPNGQVTHYTMTPAVDPTPAVPITDVENLDRTRKYFRDRMDLPQIGQDAITKEQNASVTGILNQIDHLMETNSPNFVAGKALHADLSRNLVQPVAEGPLGRVAAAGDTTAAGNALLPSNPLVGSQGETADATRRLVAQDPETTTGLVRQNLGDRYAKASTVSQEGNREFAGAKFAKDVVGNDPKRAALEAVFQNLPTQDAAQMSPELMDVLEATARRKPIGSATAFNTNMTNDMGKGSPAQKFITAIKSAGTSAVTNAADAGKRIAYRRSMTSLADMFTDPNSVEQIRDALGRSLPNGLGDAALRTALQAPMATRTR